VLTAKLSLCVAATAVSLGAEGGDLLEGWEDFVPPGGNKAEVGGAPQELPQRETSFQHEGRGPGDDKGEPKEWLREQMKEFMEALRRSEGGTIRKYSPKQ
jgi:hypothetical protein